VTQTIKARAAQHVREKGRKGFLNLSHKSVNKGLAPGRGTTVLAQDFVNRQAVESAWTRMYGNSSSPAPPGVTTSDCDAMIFWTNDEEYFPTFTSRINDGECGNVVMGGTDEFSEKVAWAASTQIITYIDYMVSVLSDNDGEHAVNGESPWSIIKRGRRYRPSPVTDCSLAYVPPEGSEMEAMEAMDFSGALGFLFLGIIGAFTYGRRSALERYSSSATGTRAVNAVNGSTNGTSGDASAVKALATGASAPQQIESLVKDAVQAALQTELRDQTHARTEMYSTLRAEVEAAKAIQYALEEKLTVGGVVQVDTNSLQRNIMHTSRDGNKTRKCGRSKPKEAAGDSHAGIMEWAHFDMHPRRPRPTPLPRGPPPPANRGKGKQRASPP